MLHFVCALNLVKTSVLYTQYGFYCFFIIVLLITMRWYMYVCRETDNHCSALVNLLAMDCNSNLSCVYFYIVHC